MLKRWLGRRGVLSEREEELRARERDLLERTRSALDSFGSDVAAEDLARFREARAQLEQLFLLVIAGEFNSGKSTFINALLGERLLPEGPTPTTDRIHVLTYGEPGERELEEYVVERTLPSELLREIRLVDTPGTNAVIRRHEELTDEFVPRSDLVLFVTSADRPFTESEREFLEKIREWGKKIVLVVNKTDVLETAEDREEVRRFVLEHGTRLLGVEPELFLVSARQALRARAPEARGTGDGAGDEERERRWEESGFEAMERYLLETLDQEERIRLKLLNPLRVALRLSAKYSDVALQRLKLLAEDIEAIRAIDDQLAAFHAEMLSEFEGRLGTLHAILGGVETRGHAFFEETLRIGRIRTLLDSDAVRREFESRVISDAPRRIEEEVGRIIDWILERSHRVWRDIQSFIDRRRLADYEDRMLGEVQDSFSYNRQALLDSIGKASSRVLSTYDAELESRQIANEVQGTFATTALAEVGAVGIGTLVATVLTGAAADVTGILLATSLAVGGFYLIPRKRRKAKEELRDRIAALRSDLDRTLTRHVHDEVDASRERIQEAIAPYRRFVISQRERLEEARDEL
ncbi:MAG: dynamin family protein, partial [Gemmatimonadota bacterium]|nr:dynamin family protein [Gemmatimonadota bacterium]